jgi:hypothetical protein
LGFQSGDRCNKTIGDTKRKDFIMKKTLILLVAVFALLLVAERAMARSINFNPGAARIQCGIIKSIIAPNTGGAALTGDEIAVYRRGLCGKYRQIDWICADSLPCEAPGEDYILVKKCGKYSWVRVCTTDNVGE